MPGHRELIAQAEKKSKLGFLQLPESLQDEIFEGLDAGGLTLEAAAARCREAGHPLSHEAIARYHRAVRRERRRVEANRELSGLLESMRAQPTLQNLEGITNLIAAMVAECLSDADGLLARGQGPLHAVRALSGIMEAHARLRKSEAAVAVSGETADESAESLAERIARQRAAMEAGR